jgi:hypothetical protein
MTPTDVAVSAEDIMLLQYAYSDVFANTAPSIIGPKIGRCPNIGQLFRHFSFVFGPSINSTSLREAMLTTSASLMPNRSIERITRHSHRAIERLRVLANDTVNEADLFAICLLGFVSGLMRDFAMFHRHLNAMKSALEIVTRNNAGSPLSILWPISLDLLISVTAEIPYSSNDSVLELFDQCWHLIGGQGFVHRAGYMTLFCGDHYKESAFTATIWLDFILLNRCLHISVLREAEGSTRCKTSAAVLSVVKTDLESPDVIENAERIMKLRFADPANMPHHEDSMFSLLQHQFCRLLIYMLEGHTIIKSVASHNAAPLSKGVLDLIPTEWLGVDNCYSNTSPWFLPQVLWISGLHFRDSKYPGCI